MKSQAEIENYFTTTLNRELDELETQRCAIIQSLSYKAAIPYIGGAAVISTAAYFILKGMYGEAFDNNLPMLSIFFTLGVAGITLMKLSSKREIQFQPLLLEYQSKVLGGITKFLNPELQLEAEAGITREVFEQSGIFSRADYFQSSLLIKGVVNNVPLRMSLMQYYSFSKRERSTKQLQDTHRKKSKVVYFEGAYCILKLKTGIPNYACIREKSALRNIISEIFPDSKTPILSNTGHKAFDAQFSLHTFDEETSNKFKNSKLLVILLDFKNHQNWQVQYYLNQDELHIAIGDFNMGSFNVNTSINETLFTQTFINYVNDLIGFAEKLAAASNQTSTYPLTA